MYKKMLEEIKNIVTMRSLRTRTFFVMLVIGIVPCVLLHLAIVNNYEQRAVDLRVSTVQNQLLIVSNHLISNNYLSSTGDDPGSRNSREVIKAELEMLSDLYEGRVMIINKNCKVLMDTYNVSANRIMISEEVIKALNGVSISHYDSDLGYIEMTTPIVDKSKATDANPNGEVVGVILTSISTESIVSTMDILNRNANILQYLIITILVFTAYIITKLMIRPLDKVTDAINHVQAGYTNEAISVPGYVETVHIVDAFNHLLGRMKALDDSRQEFVANVSHELKTPMTSIKVLSDTLMTMPDAPVEMYREFMSDIASEIDRENQIITDLLALVKMDKSVQEMAISTVDINSLTELVLKRLRPIARKKDIEITFESNRPVVAEVDEVKVTMIISNLVENAIKYNHEHGWVKVILDADYKFFTLEIKDSGIGIPEDALAHIYERFYRVDKSHSREIGGTGLGLAIVKSGVLAHKGSIKVTSIEGEGTEFLITIPLKSIKEDSKA